MTTAAQVTAEVAVVAEWSTAEAAIWASRLCAAGLGTAKVIAVVDVPEHRGSPGVSHRAWGVKGLALHHDRVALVELAQGSKFCSHAVNMAWEALAWEVEPKAFLWLWSRVAPGLRLVGIG